MLTTNEKILIIREVAIDYHSGQGSRGQRLSCRCYYWLKRRDAGRLTGGVSSPARRAFYDDLAARYGDKM